MSKQGYRIRDKHKLDKERKEVENCHNTRC